MRPNIFDTPLKAIVTARVFYLGKIYKDIEALTQVIEAGYKGFLIAPSKILTSKKELLQKRNMKPLPAEKIIIPNQKLRANESLRRLLTTLAEILL